MHQIAASCVPPVHIAPIIAERVRLIIQMIPAVIIHKSVRVVIPVRVLRKMILLAVQLGIVGIVAHTRIYIVEHNLCVKTVIAYASALIGKSVL